MSDITKRTLVPELLTPGEWQVYREFCLDEIDRWQSGDKATPGQPSTGRNYSLNMTENIKRLEQMLHDLGGWGNPAGHWTKVHEAIAARRPVNSIAVAIYRIEDTMKFAGYVCDKEIGQWVHKSL